MNFNSLWTFSATLIGSFVALGILILPFTLLIAIGLIRQKRTSASSVTWLLAILLVPFIGIPAYWLFGSRKIRHIARRKLPVVLSAVDAQAATTAPQREVRDAVAHLGYEGLTRGNAMKIHANGEEAFADLIELIDKAETSIDIETFVLTADATGKAILDRLTKRAGEGVRVRLLVDGLGSYPLSWWSLRKLRKAGGTVKFFLPIWRFTLLNRSNLRDHRKIAIFDGKQVFAGGRNIADEYLGPTASKQRWADFSFVLSGPAAMHYAEIFGFDWGFATGEKFTPVDGPGSVPAPQDGAIVQVVPSGPDVTDDQLFEGILSFIFAAKKRLWIVTPYFIPTEMLGQALQIAAQRGIDLRIIVPAKGDQILPDLARSQFLRDLAAQGAKPLLYMPGMMHAKALLIDDAVAAVGSANFDSRSMFLNFEVTSVIHSAPEIRAVEAWIEKLITDSKPFDVKTSKRRDFLEGFARLVAPLL